MLEKDDNRFCCICEKEENEMELMLVMAAIVFFSILFVPVKAKAHCDTMDGPTAVDGKRALETCNINYAAKWILPEHEEELKEIFALSCKVRSLGPDAKELADRYFLENLVRIHRAGEGAFYEGLKPSGTPIDEKVAAADKCMDVGDLSPLEGLLSHEELHELEGKFQKALSLKAFDVDDVEAGRAYIEAYVDFFKTVEGEHHAHKHDHGHAAHPH
jgi:hypothetical protein